MRKPFDKKLYDENDKKAKMAAIKFLPNYFPSFKFEVNRDQYGLDLVVYQYGLFFGYVECEVKHSWEGWIFPFDTVQFPVRKEDLVEQGEGEPVLFFMTNKKVTRALIVDAADLLESPKVEVKNKYVEKGEYFFQVPVDKVIFIPLR